jgi:hypothetical protein
MTIPDGKPDNKSDGNPACNPAYNPDEFVTILDDYT